MWLLSIYSLTEKVIHQEALNFLTPQEQLDLTGQLNFQPIQSSLEPTNSIFNDSQATPDGLRLVVGVHQIIKVYQQTSTSPTVVCTVESTNLLGEIVDMTLTNKYIILRLREQLSQLYSIQVLLVADCEKYKDYTGQQNLSIIQQYFVNGSNCSGQLSAVEKLTDLLVTIGCPNAVKYQITLNGTNITLKQVGYGVIHVIKFNALAITSIMLTSENTNQRIGQNYSLSEDFVFAPSLQFIYYQKMSQIIIFDGNLRFINNQTIINEKNIFYTYIKSIMPKQLLIEVSFNENANINISLMIFEFDSSGLLNNIVGVFNDSSIQQVQQIYNISNILHIQTESAEQILKIKELSSIDYLLPNSSTKKYSVKNYTVQEQLKYPTLATSISQSLMQKDILNPSIQSKRGRQNRKLVWYNDYCIILSILDQQILLIKATVEDLTYNVESLKIEPNLENYLAGSEVEISFDTNSADCSYYQILFVSGYPVYVKFTKPLSKCYATIKLPAIAKMYGYSVIAGNISKPTQQISIIPSNIKSVLSAVISPIIVREKQPFQIKITLTDENGNQITPKTQTECEHLKAVLFNISDPSQQLSYQQYINITKIQNFSFTLNNSACMYQSTGIQYGKYIIKLYDQNDDKRYILLDEQIGQSLIFTSNKLPFKFKWGAWPAINLLIYCIFVIYISVGLPYSVYYCVERELDGEEKKCCNSKKKKNLNKFNQILNSTYHKQSINVSSDFIQSPDTQKDKNATNNIQELVSDLKQNYELNNNKIQDLQLSDEIIIKNHVGLGSLKIRGLPLLYSSDQQQDEKSFYQYLKQLDVQSNTISTIIQQINEALTQSCKQINILLNNQLIIKYLCFDDSKNNYTNQIQFWMKIKQLKSKLNVKHILKIEKTKLQEFTNQQILQLYPTINQLINIMAQFNEITSCVIINTEEIKQVVVTEQDDFDQLDQFTSIREDLKQLEKMKPPRGHGGVLSNIYITQDDTYKVGPPDFQGEDYLLFGLSQTIK